MTKFIQIHSQPLLEKLHDYAERLHDVLLAKLDQE
ncbi:hypothetical protein RP081_005174 [Escherichia coli]